MGSPEDVPWGGAYGTTGPDTGYALRLIKQRHLHLVRGEHHHNAEAAVAAIAAARASHFGRAPILADIDVAAILLGYDREGADPDRTARVEEARKRWVANISHDAGKERDLVASIPLEVLAMTPDSVRTAVAAGNWLFQH